MLRQYAIRNTQYALRSPYLYGCLLLSLLLWSLAWQVKTTYSVDVGGLQDDAYVRGFNAQEVVPELNYRWAKARSAVVFAGIGNQPVDVTIRMAGGRPAELGLDAPAVQVLARGQKFRLQTADAPADYTIFVSRGGTLDGNLTIEFDSPTFSVRGDPRELGMRIDSVTVAPARPGLQPLVMPPIDHLAYWSASLILLYLLAALLLGSPRGAAAISMAGALVVAGLVVWRRMELGLLAPQAPVLLMWGLALGILGLLVGGLVLRLAGSAAWRSAAAAAGAFAAGFLLRFGGMTYPQFKSSDIIFHVHNIENITLRDTLLWTSRLPDGTVVPYPPALYLLLSWFAGLVPDLTLLLRFALSLVDAATVFVLLYMGLVLFRSARAGALAGWIYALLPAPFLLFSPGNYSNLFAQWTFMIALAALVKALTARRATWGAWLVLGAALVLTFVSHYGMLVAAGVVAGFVLFSGLIFGDGLLRRRVLLASAVGVVALVTAFAIYYQHFVPEIDGQIRATLSKITNGDSRAGNSSFLPSVSRILGLGIGGVPLLAGLAGWGLGSDRRRLRRFLPLFAVAFLLADAVIAVLTVAAGDNTRYVLLLAPFIALGAGRVLSDLLRRGWAARALVTVVFVLLLWQLLGTWLDLIFFQYHDYRDTSWIALASSLFQ